MTRYISTGSAALAALFALAACGGAQTAPTGPDISALPLDRPPPEATPWLPPFPPGVEEQLPNGLTVVVHAMPGTGTASVALGMPGGMSAEPADKIGVSDVAVDALALGVPGKDAKSLAEEVERLGSTIEFECGADECDGSAEGLSRNLGPTLALMADMVIRPTFPEDEVRRLKAEMVTGLSYTDTLPRVAGTRLVRRLLYGDHAYSRCWPTAAGVQALTRDDVVTFHRRYITPRGAVLAIAGDVVPEEALALARAAFASWEAPLPPGEPVQAPEPLGADPAIHVVDRPGSPQSVVFVAHRALPRPSPEFLDWRAANEVLGGGAARRLFLDLREKRGLTYGAYSSLETQRLGGYQVAGADVRNEKAGEAIQAILEHIARIRTEPIPEAELREATRSIAGAFALDFDNPSVVAGYVLRQRLLDLPEDEWTTYSTRLQAVTQEAALAAAQAAWSDEGIRIVVVGDAAALRPVLEPLGRPIVVEPAKP